MDQVQIVREYYNETVDSEWQRIDGRPEFLLTCRYMDRHIKPGDTVLDIGGGPGRYALHLARRGAKVTLMDLSEGNVAFAKAEAARQDLPLRALQGDARVADTLLSEQFDHVLLMGPLYHLLEESDREQAVHAALQLLRPGGTLFTSFISQFAGLIYMMKFAPQIILDPNEEVFLSTLRNNQCFSGAAFTQALFIAQRDVLPFMARFPLQKLHFLGQEGVLSPCESNIMTQSPEVVSAWLDLAEAMCEHEELLGWAEHLLYIGRKLP